MGFTFLSLRVVPPKLLIFTRRFPHIILHLTVSTRPHFYLYLVSVFLYLFENLLSWWYLPYYTPFTVGADDPPPSDITLSEILQLLLLVPIQFYCNNPSLYWLGLYVHPVLNFVLSVYFFIFVGKYIKYCLKNEIHNQVLLAQDFSWYFDRCWRI